MSAKTTSKASTGTKAPCPPAPRHIDNARLADGTLARITLLGERIEHITPMQNVSDPGIAANVDLGGLLVLPALIDGHLHLDKTLLGTPWMSHPAGPTRASRIETELRVMPTLALSARERAGRLIRLAAAQGTGALRTHVDVNPECQLKGIEAVLQARADHADWADVQIVAFPQSGVMRSPGTLDLLEAAIAMGAEVIGGMDPCEVDCDPAGQLNGIFSIAHRHGVGVDVHLHEFDELGLFSIREICKRARALGMQGRVAVSHGFCLGQVSESKAKACADLMAEAGVSLVTHGAASQPQPPLALLRAHGVTVFAGNDNVRDTWSPYGNADMLERAALIGWRADWRTDAQMLDAFDLATASAAKATQLTFTPIEEGAPANFFAIAASCLPEALATHAPRALVVHKGRVVARNGVACDRPESL